MRLLSNNFLETLNQAKKENQKIENLSLENLEKVKKHWTIDVNLATNEIQLTPKKTSKIVKFLGLSKYLKRAIFEKFADKRDQLISFRRRPTSSPLNQIITSSHLSYIKIEEHNALRIKGKPLTSWENKHGKVCQMTVINQEIGEMLLEMEIENLHVDSSNLELLLMNQECLDYWSKRLKFNKEEDFTDTPALGKISFDLRDQLPLAKYLEGSRRKTEMEYLINASQTVVERAKFILKFDGRALELFGLSGELISKAELPNSKCAGDLGSKPNQGPFANNTTKGNLEGGMSFSSVGAEWDESEDWEDMEDSEEDDLIQVQIDKSEAEEKEQITEKQRKEWGQFENGSPVYLGFVFKHQFVSLSGKFHGYSSGRKKEKGF